MEVIVGQSIRRHCEICLESDRRNRGTRLGVLTGENCHRTEEINTLVRCSSSKNVAFTVTTAALLSNVELREIRSTLPHIRIRPSVYPGKCEWNIEQDLDEALHMSKMTPHAAFRTPWPFTVVEKWYLKTNGACRKMCRNYYSTWTVSSPK